jgi:hypothetical protein
MPGCIHRLPTTVRWLAVVVALLCTLTTTGCGSAEHTAPSLTDAAKQAAKTGGRVVAVVHAEWCSPCNELQERVLEAPSGKAALAGHQLVLIDFDDKVGHSQTGQLRVLGLPTTVILAPNAAGVLQEVSRIEGFEQDRDWLTALQTGLQAPIRPAGPANCSSTALADVAASGSAVAAAAQCHAALLTTDQDAAATAALHSLLESLPRRPTDKWQPTERDLVAGSLRQLGRHAVRVRQEPMRCAAVFAGLAAWSELPAANRPGTVYWQAKCHAEAGHLGEADAVTSAWLVGNKNSADARALVADLWVHSHVHLPDAVAMLEGLTAESADDYLWFLLGSARQQLGQQEAAAKAYAEALRRKPSSALYARHVRRHTK